MTMNLALFYDTETTGLPLWSEPSEDPRQPHIVQLAAILVDLNTRRELQCMDVIIRPDGWTIPEEVSAIHGITTEKAELLGVPEDLALALFMSMWVGRLRIGFNESFDARIMRIALKRYADHLDPGVAVPPSDEWKMSQAECAAELVTRRCALPPTEKMRAAGRSGQFKKPKLNEAYRHYFGCELENAHSALADTRACMQVYFAELDLMKEAA